MECLINSLDRWVKKLISDTAQHKCEINAICASWKYPTEQKICAYCRALPGDNMPFDYLCSSVLFAKK